MSDDKIKEYNLTPRRFWDKLDLSIHEISELGIGWLIISFVILYLTGVLKIILLTKTIPDFFIFYIFAIGISFMTHELAHKFTAQHFGARAYYRLDRRGMLITIASILIGMPLITPGAVFWHGEATSEMSIRGRVSAAGPIVNLLLIGISAVTLSLGSLMRITVLQLMALMSIWINCWLGMFNLIPIPPLDGSKVFYWNPKIWLALMLSLVALWLYFPIGLTL